MSSTTSKKKMMKIQKKKENQASQTNEKQNPTLWHCPLAYPKPMQNITNGCVLKSWRSPSWKCTTASSRPQTLVELHQRHHSYWGDDGFISCDASTRTRFPGLGKARLKVTGHCSPTFTCFTPLCSVVKSCNVKEPYAPTQKLRLCNAVGFEGRFYAMSLQGSIVVIEEAGSSLGVTRVGGTRAIPSGKSRHFRECMVLSEGEILAVFLVSRDSVDVVDDVEVLKLDVEKLVWVKVENIGDRALILGEGRCMWVEACEKGFKRSCVYFTHSWANQWFVFHMETGKIVPFQVYKN